MKYSADGPPLNRLPLNRLSGAKDNNSVSLNGGVTNYIYDTVGNLQSYQYPNAVTTSYAFNSLNECVSGIDFDVTRADD